MDDTTQFMANHHMSADVYEYMTEHDGVDATIMRVIAARRARGWTLAQCMEWHDAAWAGYMAGIRLQ